MSLPNAPNAVGCACCGNYLDRDNAHQDGCGGEYLCELCWISVDLESLEEACPADEWDYTAADARKDYEWEKAQRACED